MRVLVAFDKFKDALGAEEACRLVGETLRLRKPGTVLDLCPLTDGGEGFARILSLAAGGSGHRCPVTGPLGNAVEGEFGLVPWSHLSPEVRTRLGYGLRQRLNPNSPPRSKSMENNHPWNRRTSPGGGGKRCRSAFAWNRGEWHLGSWLGMSASSGFAGLGLPGKGDPRAYT
jgi:Glycerate kinase family